MRSVNEYERAVRITEKADDHLSNIIESRDAKAIMLSVKGGGCAGFTYEWDVMDSIERDAYDAIPLTNGYLCISPSATLFITNTTIDYTEDISGSRIVFKNPNATSQCGCGESFGV